MEQAQVMQGRMLALQQELGAQHITHQVADGLVSFTSTARKEPVAIKLDARVLELSDVTLIEDLIMLAIKGAAERVDALLAERTEAVMADLGLPPGFEIPGGE